MIGSIIADVIIFFFVEVIGKLLVGVYTFLKALLLSFKSFFIKNHNTEYPLTHWFNDILTCDVAYYLDYFLFDMNYVKL